MRTRSFRTGLSQAYWAHYVDKIEHTDTKAIVIESARTIYIPIPKAANSSARLALAQSLGVDTSGVKTLSDIHSGLLETIPSSEALKRAGPNWFVFTIVRHPYVRAHSAWWNKLADHDKPFKPLRAMGLEKGDSFERFLWVLNVWPRKMLNDHFIPQTDLLSRALAHPGLAIYRMEELATGWPEICDRIEAQGGVRPADMPHLNRSARPIELDFSATAMRRMKRLYGRDFGPLGYQLPA